MDFESRVWDCDGGDSEAFRGLHLGNRQGSSKNGGGGLKVLIFHCVPQALEALDAETASRIIEVVKRRRLVTGYVASFNCRHKQNGHLKSDHFP